MTRKEWRSLTSFGVILLIFCASLVIGIGAAAAAPSVSIDPIATTGLNQGNTFTVTVDVDSDTNDLRAVDMDLYYDPSALQVNSITEEGLLGTSILEPTTNGYDNAAGKISYGIASTATSFSPKDGTFVTIVFEVKAATAAGTYNLNLDDVLLLDGANDDILGVVVTDGTATVVGTPSTLNPTVKVNPIATSGLNQGNTFTVTVDVDSDTNDLRAVDMDLYYDPSALQVNSITEEGLLGTSILEPTTNGYDNAAGKISYGIASTATSFSPKDGTFVTIVFEVKAATAAGTYNLNLDDVLLLDGANDDILGVVVTDGTATVVGTPSTLNPTVKVNPIATSGLNQGNTFTVTVDVDSDTNDLRAVDMDLYYDPSALQVNSITEEGLLGTSILEPTINGYDNVAGKITYGIASTAGTFSPQSGTFISIVFQIKDTAAAGTYNLNLDDVLLLNGDNADILGVVVTDGTATVGPIASAVRTLPASVQRGEQFTVSMDLSDYGTTGSVVETIPESFTYVNSTLDASNVTVVNDTVTFTLWGETNFEYDVTASNTEGTYTFSGMLTDESANEVVVSGDTLIDVVLPDGIPLMEEWNFISVPYILENSSVDNILTGVNYTVLLYKNAENSSWGEVTTVIDPLKGYWIKIPTGLDTQVILMDVLVQMTPGDAPSLQLYEGWNHIGSTDPVEVLSAEFSLSFIDEYYSHVWGPWSPDESKFEYFGHTVTDTLPEDSDRHVGTDEFMMSPYKGYLVYVDENCTLNAIGI